jgi:predicted Ser/Thr protein kinase
MSTRFAYKVLSETFNFDTSEVAADPVHLMFAFFHFVNDLRMRFCLEKSLHDFRSGYPL